MNTPNSDFSNTCRCCGRRELNRIQNSLELQSLYTFPKDAVGVLSIAEIIAATTPKIEIDVSDGLPQLICERCIKKLLEMQRFQEMCLLSDKKFRSQIKQKQTVKPSYSVTLTEDEPQFENWYLQNPLSINTKAKNGFDSNTGNNVSLDKTIETNLNTNNVPPIRHDGRSSSTATKPVVYEIDESDDDEVKMNANKQIRNSNDRQHTCKLCGATFGTIKMYNDHKEIHDDNQNNPEYWERRFGQTQSHRRHMFIPKAISPQPHRVNMFIPRAISPQPKSPQEKPYRRGGRKERIRRLRAHLRNESNLSEVEINRQLEEQDRPNQRNHNPNEQQQRPIKLIPVRVTNIASDCNSKNNRSSSFATNRH